MSRWTPEQAHAWYAAQPWLCGVNYIPAYAVNQLAMWQAETFDPAAITRELGWAQALGLNSLRIFLHDLPWRTEPDAFLARIDTVLASCAAHAIRPMLVFFDSVWDPAPRAGPQHPPVPGVHNSGWVQSPGRAVLEAADGPDLMRAYVQGVVGAFADDARVLAWDLWNEPDNLNGGTYGATETPDKLAIVGRLLPDVFAWARAANPTQPLTSATWRDGNISNPAALSAVERAQIDNSDVLSFHNYGWPETFDARAAQLASYGRPVVCTEWMARGTGSIIDLVLPRGKALGVGMYAWGFVNGATQTNLPWDSWARPYTQGAPPLWFHDLLRPDGTPYRAREAEIIRALTGGSMVRTAGLEPAL